VEYRVVVWGTGVVYDGTKPEALRQFNLFVRNQKTQSPNLSVDRLRFSRNFEIIRVSPFLTLGLA
jgi:hypothetical protein